MPPNIRKSSRIRSSTYKASSINTRPTRRVDVRVAWIDSYKTGRHYQYAYYGRLNPVFKVMDTQTIGGVLNKVRTKLMDEYPVLADGFVMQLNYYSRNATYPDEFDTPLKVQIKPSMGRNTKLSSLMPRGQRFDSITLYIYTVKGATKKIVDKENPGISYRASNVFRF
jgi:hypothetical protein